MYSNVCIVDVKHVPDKTMYLDISRDAVSRLLYKEKLSIYKSIEAFIKGLSGYSKYLNSIGFSNLIMVDVDYSYFMYVRGLYLKVVLSDGSVLEARYDMGGSLVNSLLVGTLEKNGYNVSIVNAYGDSWSAILKAMFCSIDLDNIPVK